MTAPERAEALFASLPADTQKRLRSIAAEARGLFGQFRHHQRLFDAHVDFIETLTTAGATHAEIGLLLFAVGIFRDDGRALSRGTISSGLGRARERAAARRGAAEAPAPAARLLQPAAAACSGLQQSADGFSQPHPLPAPRRRRQAPQDSLIPDVEGTSPPVPAAPSPAKDTAARSPPPPGSSATANNLRAASIINHLRRTS
jgi:hypothetical protein